MKSRIATVAFADVHEPLVQVRLHYALDARTAPATMTFDGSDTCHTVVQLNLESAILQLADGPPPPAGPVHVTLHVGYASFDALQAEVIPLDEPVRALVAVRFARLSLQQARTLLRLIYGLIERGQASGPAAMVQSFATLTDPDAITRVWQALALREAAAWVCTGPRRRWSARAVRFVPGKSAPLHIAYSGPTPQAPCVVELLGYNTVFRATTTAHPGASPSTLTFELPEQLDAIRHRERRRSAVPDGIAVRLRHPLWPELEMTRPVHNVSATGLALFTDAHHDLLYPGLRLPDVALLIDGALACSGAAVVCHITPGAGAGLRADLYGGSAGLAFAPHDAVADARWLALVHRHLHPHARSGAYWRDFSWCVYERSGYFRLSGKDPHDFEHMRPSFDASSGRFDAAPWLGIQAVWPSERGIEATFTFVKIYSRTWFGFQLAKWPGGKDVVASSQQVLLDLYLRAFEHMQHDRSMRWVAGYLEANVPWNKIAQFGWAKGRVPAGQVCLRDFRLLEGRADGGPPEQPHGWTVRDADERQIEQLCTFLAKHRPAAWLDCLDLRAIRAALADTESMWAAAGMRRQRRIVVAERDGQVMAAATLETGEDGVSLFALLDGVRLFAMCDEGRQA